MSRRMKILLVGAVIVAAGLAVGLTLGLRSGGAKAPPSHAEYVRLYEAATVGSTRIADVENEWPQPPYQNYHDGNGNHCFEWFDKPDTGAGMLFDLCFDKKGVLLTKQTP
jgi:hypothetical protein